MKPEFQETVKQSPEKNHGNAPIFERYQFEFVGKTIARSHSLPSNTSFTSSSVKPPCTSHSPSIFQG
ncbi:hypothetical protein WDU94_015066 [Cyamophila willieti]